MGSAPAMRPARLAEKLSLIRAKLGLTQAEMADSLSDNQWKLIKGNISRFENGMREPGSIILLRYARIAGVKMEVLVDDELDLPKKFL